VFHVGFSLNCKFVKDYLIIFTDVDSLTETSLQLQICKTGFFGHQNDIIYYDLGPICTWRTLTGVVE